AEVIAAFRQGLGDAGYVEGHNVAVEFRWADGDYGRLPQLADDLARRKVAVIATPGTSAAALAAKAATGTIPIVFAVGQDPVKLGLVASLARPGGKCGVNFLSNELVAKRIGLLRELVPAATNIAFLVNPTDAVSESVIRNAQSAADASGVRLVLLRASTPREIDAAFAALARERVDALFIAPGTFFNARRVQLVVLAAHHRIPTT